MSSLTLRPYQSSAVDTVRLRYAAGVKKILLWLPTGGGKTVIFCRILDGVTKKNRTAIMVVRGAALVDQASQRLFREGIDHGCLQANHWNRKPKAPIQVCSIDTLYRRKIAPPADLIVIDEAHLATSESFRWLFAQYPDAFYLPVTATPYVKTGLRHVADEIVHPISFRDLIKGGWLAKPRYFAPTTVDLTGVRTDKKTGDYATQDLAIAMDKAAIYGDVITNYREKLDGLPAVLFAIDVEHSLMIRDRFREAGIAAEHIEANTPAGERKRILDDLNAGTCKVVTNVGVLTTGVDIPNLRGVILCRPTKSKNLYIQMIGRGTRIAESKTEFIVLDHANNITEHGFVEDEDEVDLDGKPIRGKGETKPTQCEKCYGFFYPAENWEERNPELAALGKTGRDYVCPYCRHDNSSARESFEREKTENVKAVLREITSDDELKTHTGDTHFERLVSTALAKGYKGGWVYYKLRDKFGETYAKGKWPDIKKRFADVS